MWGLGGVVGVLLGWGGGVSFFLWFVLLLFVCWVWLFGGLCFWVGGSVGVWLAFCGFVVADFVLLVL
ncbi:hypothetical protein, partial [Pseudomonas syringae group genomosp. 7]|uniref:hypothetical protein n=1 Tax=Pseudomonas syringae group genomosp. 7 TaxID=251699 RepID=UPI00376FB2D2